jgi:hypothetical protein
MARFYLGIKMLSFRGAWRIKDAPLDKRTHACAERGGEPGIHIPEAGVHGFRASPSSIPE